MKYLLSVLFLFSCATQKESTKPDIYNIDSGENIGAVADDVFQQVENSILAQKEVIAIRPLHNSQNKLFLSSHVGSFQDFVNACILTGDTGIIDKPVTIDKTIDGNGSFSLISANSATITIKATIGFLIAEGNHYFEGLNIIQQPGATAFKTKVQNNILWTNTIQNCTVTGGAYAYYSDRGGDSTHTNVTIINNSVFKTDRNCIAVFSQDGAYKALHMSNVDLSSDTSHNLYIHPNVSLRFNNVRSVKVGKGIASSTALALHQYSGGGVLGKAKYVELTKCTTEKEGGQWQISEPLNRTVMLDSCDLSLYSNPQPTMYARNCHFFNKGNGSYFNGTAVNCTGELWPVSGSVIQGGNYSNLTLNTGLIQVSNASIKYISSKSANLNTTFKNCRVETAYLANTGTVTFIKTALPRMLYGRPVPKIISQ